MMILKMMSMMVIMMMEKIIFTDVKKADQEEIVDTGDYVII